MRLRSRLALVLLVANGVALVAENAVAPVYPPLVTSSQGALADGGQSYELVMEAARRVGTALTVRIEPFARAVATATTQKGTLVFPLLRTPVRDLQFEWLGPVNRVDYRLFRLRTSASSAPLRTVTDIGEDAVGVITNDIVSQKFRALGVRNLTSVSEFEQLVRMLVAHRITYLASTTQSIESALNQLSLPSSTVEVAFELAPLLPGETSYVAVSKGSSPDLVLAWKNAFGEMVRDGTWDSIFRRYQATRR